MMQDSLHHLESSKAFIVKGIQLVKKIYRTNVKDDYDDLTTTKVLQYSNLITTD